MSRRFSMLILIGCIGAQTALSGCGGHFLSQAAKDYYTVTVTATSGSVQHTISFTLNVQ